ncbi:hypothetical protein DYY67_0626 [Candidatus Nitrosotalea sp. TS]|nr:hypothetical protein [Candidatus Nitrosotalea sp. TS]
MMKPILCTASVFLILTVSPLNLVYAEQQSYGPSTKIWNTNVNKQIQLVADITNNQDVKQPFAYIVQVLGSDGKVVMLNWMTGTLQPHQSMSPAQSWTPTRHGTYTAQIFDWPCLVACGTLSEPLTMNIVVT